MCGVRIRNAIHFYKTPNNVISPLSLKKLSSVYSTLLHLINKFPGLGKQSVSFVRE